jgi:allophanate hydrolase subunit 1
MENAEYECAFCGQRPPGDWVYVGDTGLVFCHPGYSTTAHLEEGMRISMNNLSHAEQYMIREGSGMHFVTAPASEFKKLKGFSLSPEPSTA